jgi:hypothetical protein
LSSLFGLRVQRAARIKIADAGGAQVPPSELADLGETRRRQVGYLWAAAKESSGSRQDRGARQE